MQADQPYGDTRMPLNPVSYFEIPVVDLQRAQAFYERVFDVALELVVIDGHPMALFPFADGAPGATGALAQGDAYVPGRNGPRIYFAVDDIDATLALAVAAGAALNYPVTEVGGYGWVAEFVDPEGNVIALHGAVRRPGAAAAAAVAAARPAR